MSKTCTCPEPPGGSIQCDEDQLGICGVVDGRIKRICVTVRPINNSLGLVNWALTQIEGSERDLYVGVNEKDLNMLQEGIYNDYKSNISFTLPQKIKDAINEVRRDNDTNTELTV